MKPDTYVQMDTLPMDPRWWDRQHWLPRVDQMLAALRLDIAEALDPYERGEIRVTMQQGVGMVVALGLATGLIPFLVGWIGATMLGTSTVLLEITRTIPAMNDGSVALTQGEILASTAQQIAGLSPQMPGWLAAFLSALGGWISLPLGWLANWIVYGAAVYVLLKLSGARPRLEQFYAVTAFAAVPMVLTALAPVPFLGPLAGFVALILAFIIYVRSIQSITTLQLPSVILCATAPLAAMALLSTMAAVGLFILLQ